jgi:pilus assembly protein CpaB
MKMRVVVLVIALLAGVLAAFLSMQSSPPPADDVALAPQMRSRDVLVASRDLAPGSALSKDHVRWLAWPAEGISSTFMVRADRPEAISDIQGAIVRSQFYEGEPIREGKLARAESGFLSAILPSGKRAVAVRVTAQSTAGGFILPNDRVDVVHTATASARGETVSQTLLHNVRILAIDQKVEEKEGESVVVGKTATLELDPGQVELVTAAEASGTISLALRSIADAGDEDDSGQRTTGVVRIFRSGQSQLVKTQ